MISIKILKDGILTHGQDFKNINLANDWIQKCENKPSHPWGRPAGWFKLVRENTIEFMEEKAILPGDILETRTIENIGSSITEVRLASEYTIEIKDLDQDIEHLKVCKRKAINTVRANFQDRIDDQYDATMIALQCAKAIEKLATGKVVPNTFTNMMTTLDPLLTWRNTTVAAIRASKSCTDLDLINLNIPSELLTK
jgi:hypothetical protein